MNCRKNDLGSVHHDSSIERYDEDKRMLAFFDSLLQRELGNGHTHSDDDDSDSDTLSLIFTSSDDSSDGILQSDHESEEQVTLEEINSQIADLTYDFQEKTFLFLDEFLF